MFQAKVDNSKRTGAAGGMKFKQNEVDTMLLDIIGRESEVIKGLGVSSTWEAEADVTVTDSSNIVEEPVINDTPSDVTLPIEQVNNELDNTQPSCTSHRKTPIRKVHKGKCLGLMPRFSTT